MSESTEYASIKVRILASVVDIVIVYFAIHIFLTLGEFISKNNLYNYESIISWPASALYESILISSAKKSTYGMRLFNIILVNSEKNSVSLYTCFIRYILAYLPFLVIFIINQIMLIKHNFYFLCYIPFLFMAFDQYNRGWYDVICKTFVVSNKSNFL